MSLDQVNAGTKVVIKEIQGGKNFSSRLRNMGINIGDTISVVRSGPLGGPIIISSDNSEYAIGRGMAKRITVSPF